MAASSCLLQSIALREQLQGEWFLVRIELCVVGQDQVGDLRRVEPGQRRRAGGGIRAAMSFGRTAATRPY